MHLTFWNNKFDGKIDIFSELINNHKEEFNNLLLILIKRLREIFKSRTIYGELSIEETRKLYLENSDIIKQFLSSEAIVDLNGVFTASKAYEDFKIWADNKRYNSFDFKTFKDNLGEQTTISYQRTWVWIVSDGSVYRDENDIPDAFKNDRNDHTQITLYRGMRLKSSIKKSSQNIIINNNEEFVVDNTVSKLVQNGDLVEISPGTYKRLE